MDSVENMSKQYQQWQLWLVWLAYDAYYGTWIAANYHESKQKTCFNGVVNRVPTLLKWYLVNHCETIRQALHTINLAQHFSHFHHRGENRPFNTFFLNSFHWINRKCWNLEQNKTAIFTRKIPFIEVHNIREKIIIIDGIATILNCSKFTQHFSPTFKANKKVRKKWNGIKDLVVYSTPIDFLARRQPKVNFTFNQFRDFDSPKRMFSQINGVLRAEYYGQETREKKHVRKKWKINYFWRCHIFAIAE